MIIASDRFIATFGPAWVRLNDGVGSVLIEWEGAALRIEGGGAHEVARFVADRLFAEGLAERVAPPEVSEASYPKIEPTSSVVIDWPPNVTL